MLLLLKLGLVLCTMSKYGFSILMGEMIVREGLALRGLQVLYHGPGRRVASNLVGSAA